MTKIICIAGRKQSGKSTAAEAIQEYIFKANNLNHDDIIIYNFADSLKKICMNIFGCTYEQCYGNDEDKNSLVNCYKDQKQLTARELMQYVGTDVFRNLQENVWSNALINSIRIDNPKIAIVADCRFPNEVHSIKQEDGILVKLTRNIYNSNHPSETALDAHNFDQSKFDTIIFNNNMSIEQKNNAIYSFLKKKGLLSL